MCYGWNPLPFTPIPLQAIGTREPSIEIFIPSYAFAKEIAMFGLPCPYLRYNKYFESELPEFKT